MEAAKKKKIRNILFAVLALLLVAALIALPFLLEKQQQKTSSASILSAKAETGDIRKTLSGTGTLTDQDAEDVEVPQGVKVTEYLVKNGQFVKQGDPVAAVDKISVMETISSVRETMRELETEMESVRSGSSYTYLSAPASGRVKAVYAEAGDKVQDVILKHGSLAVLSLDGLMAVRFPVETELSIGQAVTVVLADGTETPGRVESLVDGEATVTISDRCGGIGEPVTIRSAEAQRLGSGELYVHSPWKAMASGGTVYQVYASAERDISIYGIVLALKDAEDSGSFEKFAVRHREYEDVAADLFLMYQDGVLRAPCDGCVSGVDEDILKLLSGEENGLPLLTLLSLNTPPDKQDKSFANVIGIVTEEGSAMLQTWATEIEDYADTAFLVTASESFTKKYTGGFAPVYKWTTTTAETEVWTPFSGDAFAEGTVYYEETGNKDSVTADLTPAEGKTYYTVTLETVEAGSWTQTAAAVGGIYIFAFDGSDSLVFMVDLGISGEVPKTDGDMPGGGGSGTPSGGGMPSGGGGGMPSGGGTPSGGGGGSAGSAGSAEAEQEIQKPQSTVLLSVTPQETVTVSITVDELDILSVRPGQEAQVTLDALPGQEFSGRITKVNTIASNEGGNSKYSAVVELKRNGNMLGGMNASANITVEERSNVLLIPSEALTEEHTKAIVYTAYDAETETLFDPVPVETGLSDGNQVQILSGLQEGDIVWYSYYDTLEIKGLNDNFPAGRPNP